MRPHFSTWRGEDKAGGQLVVRSAERRDAAAFLRHTAQLVDETVFMLKDGRDGLPAPEEQRLIFEFFERSTTFLCLVATRPSRGLKREPILASLTLTGARTQRSEHCVQLGMGVLQSSCGLGIGGLLLDAALTWARANPILRRVRLQVYEENHRARHLYTSRGFVEEGVMADEVMLADRWVPLVGMSAKVWSEGR